MLKPDLIAYLDQYEDGDDVNLDVVADHFGEQKEGASAPGGSLVTLLLIETKHGPRTCLHSDHLKAIEHLTEYVRGCWHEVAGCDGVPDEAPQDDQQAIDLYFDTHYSESYSLSVLSVLP